MNPGWPTPLARMPPTAPSGAVVKALPPTNVRVGDRIWLDGTFVPIVDLRATQDGAGRVLIFEGRDPLIMHSPMPICRPIERSSTSTR